MFNWKTSSKSTWSLWSPSSSSSRQDQKGQQNGPHISPATAALSKVVEKEPPKTVQFSACTFDPVAADEGFNKIKNVYPSPSKEENFNWLLSRRPFFSADSVGQSMSTPNLQKKLMRSKEVSGDVVSAPPVSLRPQPPHPGQGRRPLPVLTVFRHPSIYQVGANGSGPRDYRTLPQLSLSGPRLSAKNNGANTNNAAFLSDPVLFEVLSKDLDKDKLCLLFSFFVIETTRPSGSAAREWRGEETPSSDDESCQADAQFDATGRLVQQ